MWVPDGHASCGGRGYNVAMLGKGFRFVLQRETGCCVSASVLLETECDDEDDNLPLLPTSFSLGTDGWQTLGRLEKQLDR